MSFDVTEPFPRLRTDNGASGEEAVDTKLRLCVELALKGVLCTRTGSKGPLNAGLTARRSDDYGMLKSPNKAKQLAMAATARVIWLCGCMWYWPGK